MLGDHEQNESAPPAPASPSVRNPSRRRLARLGVAAPVVLGSLTSRPVLGSTSTYWCTISGKLSGNLSNHENSLNCKTLGRSPGYWKNKTWPSGFSNGTMCDNDCRFSGSYVAGTFFNGYSADGRTLAAAFKRKAADGVCKIVDATEADFGSISRKATMLQVLETGGGLNDTAIAALGRATVASLLNAVMFAGTYPLTRGQIIDMFNATYMGGLYSIPNSTVKWNRDQVKGYFESLYGAL